MAKSNKEKPSGFNRIKAVAFDLDGTIYLGNQLIDGVKELLELLSLKHIKVFYFTNNSMKTREQVFKKLYDMGIELTLDQVYTSAYATAKYIAKADMKNVYCIGSDDLKRQLEAEGAVVSEDTENAQATIIGLDPEFDYKKLAKAMNVIRKGGKIIACNVDRNYPVENGVLLPACGAIVAAVEGSLGVKTDYIVGKPGIFMIELLAKDWGLKNIDILVIGDTFDSDIAMARKFGSPSILITEKKVKENSGMKVVEKTSDIKAVLEKML
ncbi:MAG: HAD-IIA family hydrolase [Candidatus Firestonebacteria bacterium]